LPTPFAGTDAHGVPLTTVRLPEFVASRSAPSIEGSTDHAHQARGTACPSDRPGVDRNAKRKAIVAHEEGHAMGLAHALHSDRLMYAGIASTSVTAPIRDDINGINALY
jgi:hypothetical protein